MKLCTVYIRKDKIESFPQMQNFRGYSPSLQTKDERLYYFSVYLYICKKKKLTNLASREHTDTRTRMRAI